jgi:NADH-quinone oxidoreductase subunit E
VLQDQEVTALQQKLAVVPRKQAACVDALRVVQRYRGWVSDDALHDLAEHLDMTPAELENVATFYNLVFRRPVGRHVILVCDSVSCWIVGYGALLAALKERLGIGLGGTTKDGRFTLLSIPCLGICEQAPALMIDDDLHTDLAPQALDRRLNDILERYE